MVALFPEQEEKSESLISKNKAVGIDVELRGTVIGGRRIKCL